MVPLKAVAVAVATVATVAAVAAVAATEEINRRGVRWRTNRTVTANRTIDPPIRPRSANVNP